MCTGTAVTGRPFFIIAPELQMPRLVFEKRSRRLTGPLRDALLEKLSADIVDPHRDGNVPVHESPGRQVNHMRRLQDGVFPPLYESGCFQIPPSRRNRVQTMLRIRRLVRNEEKPFKWIQNSPVARWGIEILATD